MDAKAKLVVLAATVPKAAASFSPEANAARARSSAALMESLDEEISRLLSELLFDPVRVFVATLRGFLRANRRSRDSLVFIII
jgi:hypothetical protein